MARSAQGLPCWGQNATVCSLDDDRFFMLFSECIEVYTLILRVLLSEYCRNRIIYYHRLVGMPLLQATSSSICVVFWSPSLNTLNASEIPLGFFNYFRLPGEELRNEAAKQSLSKCKADLGTESCLVIWAQNYPSLLKMHVHRQNRLLGGTIIASLTAVCVALRNVECDKSWYKKSQCLPV